MWQKHIDDCRGQIKALAEGLNIGKIHNETNADKGYLAKELKKDGLRAVTYHENMNKFIKITTYLRSEWNNVIFVDGTDEEYIKQILDYNEEAEHDDAADSLASIIRILKGKKDTKDRYISEMYDGGLTC